MQMTAAQAMWLLPFVAPICLWVAWSDLSRMKIPNRAVLALVAVFAVVGLWVFPLPVYLWRWSHLAVLLVVGMLANAVGMMGAGDAKFIAAAAPYVAIEDGGPMMLLLAATIVIALALHSIVRFSALRQLAPNWASWTAGRRFPLGFPLALALFVYLSVPLLG